MAGLLSACFTNARHQSAAVLADINTAWATPRSCHMSLSRAAPIFAALTADFLGSGYYSLTCMQATLPICKFTQGGFRGSQAASRCHLLETLLARWRRAQTRALSRILTEIQEWARTCQCSRSPEISPVDAATGPPARTHAAARLWASLMCASSHALLCWATRLGPLWHQR